jgi:hypothetical protein
MAFGRPKSQNSHFYTTLVSSPSRIAPTDSAEEAVFDQSRWNRDEYQHQYEFPDLGRLFRSHNHDQQRHQLAGLHLELQ